MSCGCPCGTSVCLYVGCGVGGQLADLYWFTTRSSACYRPTELYFEISRNKRTAGRQCGAPHAHTLHPSHRALACMIWYARSSALKFSKMRTQLTAQIDLIIRSYIFSGARLLEPLNQILFSIIWSLYMFNIVKPPPLPYHTHTQSPYNAQISH